PKVLVHETGRDQIVQPAWETRGGDVRLDETIVDPAASHVRQHLGRQIDAVESNDTARAEPRTRPAGSAPEVGGVHETVPWHGLGRVEQDEIHLVLHRRLVGDEPVTVSLADGDNRIAATVELRELQHRGMVRGPGTSRAAGRARPGDSA